jgi:tetratricopeptide (TPR) repeat protein
MVGRVIAFPRQSSSFPEGTPAAAKRILSTAVSERLEKAVELAIEDPEVLLSLCGCVREFLYSDPRTARNEASFFYRYLQTLERKVGLFDEHDYFLGEFALIAGTACRQLSLRDDSRLWFDRAEAGYRQTANAVADLSRLAYQRLALRMEERQLETVLELVPALIHGFSKLSMREDEVKARFLEAIALAESDRQTEATAAYEDICRIAEQIGTPHLFAQACGNLIHMAAMRGDTAAGIEYSRRALPGLRRSNDRVGLAKAQWGLANLLRESGQLQSAIDAYHEAQSQFEEIEMRADTAAIHLILADIALELGRESDALRSILAALPVIDELRMVPEGLAAITLLRESVRQQRVDRKALRELHGYFAELPPT